MAVPSDSLHSVVGVLASGCVAIVKAAHTLACCHWTHRVRTSDRAYEPRSHMKAILGVVLLAFDSAVQHLLDEKCPWADTKSAWFQDV